MKKHYSYLILLSLLWSICMDAQINDSTLLNAFRWRNIGPANQGGRIVDIEAENNNFAHVWLATGSGGVWKSINAGTSWTPVFDDYDVSSIGDIALFQANPNIVWVGTGEANNRNSVSWGNGVYKSEDGGKSFKHMGLKNTHQIARVLTHPTNPNIVYVAAVGHLWGYSGIRGLFKTTDGGKTWVKLKRGLPQDNKTGCTDIIVDPQNPNILYAAFYHRLRQPWTFHSGGEGGGIYKSINGGKSWKKLRIGLPKDPTGRIGLAISQQNPEVVMAIVEAEKTGDLKKPGSGVYRSVNRGKSWEYINTYNNRPFYYSQIRINPHDDRRVYVLTTRFMVSDDAGKTFKNGSLDQEVHGDFHALWLDPTDRDRYYLGADKGASITHDHGQHFQLFDNLPIGQFYRIGADMRDPYYVYGGLQDNGTYGVASFGRDARGILNDHNWKLHWGDGQFIQPDPTDWTTIYTEMENGNSMLYNPKTHDIRTIRPLPKNISNYEKVIPDSLKNKPNALRFNWTSPLVLSVHDHKTLYAAGNYVYKTTNQGETWTIISPDLSTNNPTKIVVGKSGGVTPDNTGAETHCAIHTLSESPINPAVVWVGTDDGLVQVTRTGGKVWQNVRAAIPDVPEGLWVSRVEASHIEEGRAYVTFDGHRSDEFQPWVFKTDDFGQTWQNLRNNLPHGEVIRVIREDRKNPNLLFLGTEFGIWTSLNAGKKWVKLMPNLPTVPIYDLLIHPRENDLIAGTHGRSLWVMDDISPLQELNDNILEQSAHLFDIKTATLWENTSRGGQRGHFWFAGENPPTIKPTSSIPRAQFSNGAMLSYFVGEGVQDSLVLKISDGKGLQHVKKLASDAGIHRYVWNLEFDPEPLSDAQFKQADDLFRELNKRYTSASLRRGYEQLKKAKTPKEQRQSLRVLRVRLNELDESFDIPMARAGTYEVELIIGEEMIRKTLVIREDPLTEGR